MGCRPDDGVVAARRRRGCHCATNDVCPVHARSLLPPLPSPGGQRPCCSHRFRLLGWHGRERALAGYPPPRPCRPRGGPQPNGPQCGGGGAVSPPLSSGPAVASLRPRLHIRLAGPASRDGLAKRGVVGVVRTPAAMARCLAAGKSTRGAHPSGVSDSLSSCERGFLSMFPYHPPALFRAITQTDWTTGCSPTSL